MDCELLQLDSIGVVPLGRGVELEHAELGMQLRGGLRHNY